MKQYTKTQPNITCEHCGHKWHTESQYENVTCPNCLRKTDNPNITLTFFGDGRLLCGMKEHVVYFAKARVVCDYTECGMYIAGKHAKHGYDSKETTLETVINGLRQKNVKVTAWNNGIAGLFRSNDIKTLTELETYLGDKEK